VLAGNPDGTLSALIDDCADAAMDSLLPGRLPWTRSEFTALAAQVRDELLPSTQEVVDQATRVLTAAHEVQRRLPDQAPASQAESVADIRDQLAGLLPAGFVARAGRARLPDLVRYLTAIRRRLDTLPLDPATDRARMQRVHAVQEAFDQLRVALPPVRAQAADITELRWQIEELRVSLWAQQLGTPRPVSERRIFRAIDSVAV
jgi:ATP-dependent helicase HrpA